MNGDVKAEFGTEGGYPKGVSLGEPGESRRRVREQEVLPSSWRGGLARLRLRLERRRARVGGAWETAALSLGILLIKACGGGGDGDGDGDDPTPPTPPTPEPPKDEEFEAGPEAEVHEGGRATNDTVSYKSSDVGVEADLDLGGIGGYAEGDSYTSIENLIGSDHDDTLRGDDQNNRLYGGEGDDQLLSDEGDDELHGGEGGDSLDGGMGIDTVSYELSDTGVTADLSLGVGNGGDAEGDSYTSIENLIGSDHNDRLRGSGGDDTLIGGEGSDQFEFYKDLDAASDQSDVIHDFSVAEDVIVFYGTNEAQSLAAFMAAATDDGNNLVYDLGGDGLNVLTIIDIQITQITENNFMFLG